MDEPNVTITQMDYHRNGVSGAGFWVLHFTDRDTPMFGIVFQEFGHVAVFNRDLLAAGEIRFFHNSWRGDVYEPYLREAIKRRNIELYGPDASSGF